MSGEMKYYDTANDGVALATTTTTWPAGTMVDPVSSINLGAPAVATPLCLCVPTVGSALNQRIGREITIRKVKVHGRLHVAAQIAQPAGDSSCVVRVALVLDTQTNSAQMTGAQLFNDAIGPLSTLQSFQNPNNFGRFRVLKDKQFSFTNMNLAGSPTTGDLVQSGMNKPFKMSYVFPQGLKVRFNNTNGGNVADIIDNSLHLVAATDNGALAPAIMYYSRVCYKE